MENDEEKLIARRNAASEEARAFVVNRQRAYRATFDSESELNKQVLSDLALFCRADLSTFHTDPRVHALMEGRREVWLRIQEHLNIDSDLLVRIKLRNGA